MIKEFGQPESGRCRRTTAVGDGTSPKASFALFRRLVGSLCATTSSMRMVATVCSSSTPYSQHSLGTSVRAHVVGKWLMSFHLKPNLGLKPVNRPLVEQLLLSRFGLRSEGMSVAPFPGGFSALTFLEEAGPIPNFQFARHSFAVGEH